VGLFFCRLQRRSSIVVTEVINQARISTNRLTLLLQDPIINFRSSQADTQPRAGDLQRAYGHAENISNLFSTFSPINEIFYLLKSFWRKLY
jgi:hypothetical protein